MTNPSPSWHLASCLHRNGPEHITLPPTQLRMRVKNHLHQGSHWTLPRSTATQRSVQLKDSGPRHPPPALRCLDTTDLKQTCHEASFSRLAGGGRVGGQGGLQEDASASTLPPEHPVLGADRPVELGINKYAKSVSRTEGSLGLLPATRNVP